MDDRELLRESLEGARAVRRVAEGGGVEIWTVETDEIPLCAYCGQPFMRADRRRIYCSAACKQAAWAARHKPERAVRRCDLPGCDAPAPHPGRAAYCSHEHQDLARELRLAMHLSVEQLAGRERVAAAIRGGATTVEEVLRAIE